jgi:hypothetical protein
MACKKGETYLPEFSWVINCIILFHNTSASDTGFVFIWGQSLKHLFYAEQ